MQVEFFQSVLFTYVYIIQWVIVVFSCDDTFCLVLIVKHDANALLYLPTPKETLQQQSIYIYIIQVCHLYEICYISIKTCCSCFIFLCFIFLSLFFPNVVYEIWSSISWAISLPYTWFFPSFHSEPAITERAHVEMC